MKSYPWKIRTTSSGVVRIVCCAALGVVTAANAADSPPVPFEAVQGDDFAIAGSLSNSWADIDRDGDLDLAVSSTSGELRLYRNDDGHFVNIGTDAGLPVSGPVIRGLTWGDYDSDGWPDLYAGSGDAGSPSLLFRNVGGREFRLVETEPALAAAGRSSRQSSWVDFDNDGDLDFYAANREGANALFRRDGSDFVTAGLQDAGGDTRPTVGACWLDFDLDGDLDLFLANQAGATDALWRNDGTSFVDIAPSLGMDRPGRPAAAGSVGCAVGDYDNDGQLDLFVASYGRNVLYRNLGDGKFADVTEQFGLAETNHAVGAAWGDYDNDGFLDLFVTAYTGPRGEQQPADRLYRNLEGKRFVNVLGEQSPLNVVDHGVQWVDYDRDGALDLSLTRGYTSSGGHFLFRNGLDAESAHRSLEIVVLDHAGHATRFGAEVRLYSPTGKLLATRQVSTGDGYNSQGMQPLHFGFGAAAPVTVEVTFMSPTGRKTQRIEGVRPSDYTGRSLIVREGPAEKTAPH